MRTAFYAERCRHAARHTHAADSVCRAIARLFRPPPPPADARFRQTRHAVFAPSSAVCRRARRRRQPLSLMLTLYVAVAAAPRARPRRLSFHFPDIRRRPFDAMPFACRLMPPFSAAEPARLMPPAFRHFIRRHQRRCRHVRPCFAIFPPLAAACLRCRRHVPLMPRFSCPPVFAHF